jgi:hypothetical protein
MSEQNLDFLWEGFVLIPKKSEQQGQPMAIVKLACFYYSK